MAPSHSKPTVDLEVKIGEHTDAGKFRKLAARVQKTLKENCLHPEPMSLNPDCVLVHWLNREGAPPNVPYLHHGLLKGYKAKGYDRTRPQVGICVKIESPEMKAKLLEHNKRFSKGSSLLPPIYEDQKDLYGSLAYSHGNLTLRLIRANCKSPAGDLSRLPEEDQDLKEAVTHGHRWWILPETVLKEQMVDISLWRNQDQNENQGSHEMEILQTIVATADEFSKTHKTIPMGDLVTKAQKRNPAKISPSVLTTLTKLFMLHLEENELFLIQDLVDFHSSTVNPNELVLSNNFFHVITSAPELLKKGVLRHYLFLSAYTPENAMAQAGGPSKANFLETSTVTSLVKKQDLVDVVDKELRTLREKYLPLLEKLSSPKQARLDLAWLADLVIRCLLSKAWNPACPFKVPVGTGKFTADKIKVLAGHWAKWVESEYPESNFCKDSGLILVEPEDAGDLAAEVNLEEMRSLKREHSEPASESGKKFSRGDEVTVVRRMSWVMDESGTRKDIVVGTCGIIEGWADLEQRQVLLKVSLKMPDKSKRDIVQSCYPRNLQLTSEYKVAQAGVLAGKSKEKPSDPASSSGGNQVPQWLLKLGAEPDKTKVEDKWHKLLADADNLNKNFWLKSRIGICLESLAELLPQYSPKDLLLCHRQNDKGAWRQELWTQRAFEPLELQLAPFSSQLKDTHLMVNANAVVGIPKHGPGAHPEGHNLALDGRSRNIIASKGAIDAAEHTGSLFWLITRASKPSDANLTLEAVAWEHKVTLHMPLKKRKLSTEWESKDLPTIPILVNKKTIKAHERLVVFIAEKKPKEDSK